MNCAVFIIFFGVVAGVLAMPFDIVQDGDGEEYLMVPLQRSKRQGNIGGNVGPGPNGGVLGSVHGGGAIINNPNHRLDGTLSASKEFRPSGPLSTGGQLDYTHKPSGSGLGIGAQNTRGFGTDVTASGRYNIYSSRNTDVGLTGQYSRHYGGAYGTGRPNYGAHLGVTHRF